MSVNSDQMEWIVSPVDPIILNALVQRDEEQPVALADETSRTVVTEAFDVAVDQSDKKAFDDVAKTVRDEVASVGEQGYKTIESVIGSVRDELAGAGVAVKLTHENVLSLSKEEATIYTFSRTRDPDLLAGLELSEEPRGHLIEAIAPLEDENWEQAAEALMCAVDAAKTISDGVLTRTLAALCYHWAGDDDRPVDLVGEAVTLDSSSWLPWLPGYAADADPAYATSDEFREGKYGVTAFLRYIAMVPEAAAITSYVGYSDGDSVAWSELGPRESCVPIERFDTETYVRFEISGPVDAFPAFQAYYIGLGIVDLEVNEVRDVLDVLEDGPTGEAVSEQVRFKRPCE